MNMGARAHDLSIAPHNNEFLNKKAAYVYYTVFQLPDPAKYFNEYKKSLLSPEDFLSKCLLSAARMNERNILDPSEANARFYFSDKAKAQSYRIPHTFNQLPSVFFDAPDAWVGIIGLQVYRDEKPEVKGFHQRSVALKDIFNRNRVTQLYVAEHYPSLDFLGHDKAIPIDAPNNSFRQIEIDF